MIKKLIYNEIMFTPYECSILDRWDSHLEQWGHLNRFPHPVKFSYLRLHYEDIPNYFDACELNNIFVKRLGDRVESNGVVGYGLPLNITVEERPLPRSSDVRLLIRN